MDSDTARVNPVSTKFFAVLAVGCVAALAIAPVRGVFTEWRKVQEQYNIRAASLGMAAAKLMLRGVDVSMIPRQLGPWILMPCFLPISMRRFSKREVHH